MKNIDRNLIVRVSKNDKKSIITSLKEALLPLVNNSKTNSVIKAKIKPEEK